MGVCLVGGIVGLTSGCVRDLPDMAVPQYSLSKDLDQAAVPVVRLQAPEGPTVPVKPLPEAPKEFGAKPAPTGPVAIPAPADFGVRQVSLATPSKMRVRVRAWVNGRPIFDDELMQWAGQGLEQAHRDGTMTEHFNAKLDELVDQELMYQDAVKRLEKVSPHSLDKMREFVDQEFDKSLQRWRQAKLPEDQIREIESTARRLLERSLISTEYARSRIKPMLDSVINLTQISEYYESHKNEFQTVDKVIWQDIFIPVGPNQTIEDVRRFGEDLINKCLKPGDFDRLMVYNEGDSKLRGGEGIGQRRGEIRPVELEEHLFKLREGQIGPVVPFTTGVHLIRVSKREDAGQLPLDETVQKAIRKKLESQLADREYRRIVRELRGRSVVRIEKE
jgi:parvulin-like peptidyl-prolyl isomerase